MTAENVVEYIEHTLIPKLTPERARAIMAAGHTMRDIARGHIASQRALRVARTFGLESDVMEYSERLRNAAWSHVWAESQGEALAISLILARVGVGVATVDLVGDGEYGIEDYIALVEPWVVGFPDFPLPVEET
mgnify:CR=1 FL=1